MRRGRIFLAFAVALMLGAASVWAAGSAAQAPGKPDARCIREGLAPIPVTLRAGAKREGGAGRPAFEVEWSGKPLAARCKNLSQNPRARLAAPDILRGASSSVGQMALPFDLLASYPRSVRHSPVAHASFETGSKARRTVAIDFTLWFPHLRFVFTEGFPSPWLEFWNGRKTVRNEGERYVSNASFQGLECILKARARLRYEVVGPSGSVLGKRVVSVSVKLLPCSE